ncbi:MAG: hypothetical protein GY772_17880 [bacterium]|nr:hypothetical protein [bacterium]
MYLAFEPQKATPFDREATAKELDAIPLDTLFLAPGKQHAARPVLHESQPSFPI